MFNCSLCSATKAQGIYSVIFSTFVQTIFSWPAAWKRAHQRSAAFVFLSVFQYFHWQVRKKLQALIQFQQCLSWQCRCIALPWGTEPITPQKYWSSWMNLSLFWTERRGVLARDQSRQNTDAKRVGLNSVTEVKTDLQKWNSIKVRWLKRMPGSNFVVKSFNRVKKTDGNLMRDSCVPSE